MKTAKRNARTTTIFNGIMTAIMKYCHIKDDMSLKEIYDASFLGEFNFLDKNGKTIHNSIGGGNEPANVSRKLSFPKLTQYMFYDYPIQELSIFSFDDYNSELVKDYDIIDIKREYSKHGIDYDILRSNTNSTFLQELFNQYRLDKFRKESYLFLIDFETIFGYQCITRKEFDRIRYIIFKDWSIYDVMNGYMIPGYTICLLRQKYSVEAAAMLYPKIVSIYEYEESLNITVLKKIKNMLLSFGRGVSQEEIYDICGTLIMESARQSFKHLISDHYSADDVKHRISDILKNEFQLKHAILTDDKKNYPAYQERQESNI